MQIDLRIADDYCQGDGDTLHPLYEDEYEEDLKVKKHLRFKITPRNRLTSPD